MTKSKGLTPGRGNATGDQDVVRAGESAPPEWAPLGRTLAFLVTTGMLVVGQLYTVIPLFASMGHSFGVTAGQATWMATAFGFAYAVGFLFWGPLADRYGLRRMITAGLVSTTVATAMVAIAPGLLIGSLLRAVQGLAAATFVPAAYAYVAAHIEPRRRALALTFITSGFLVAAIAMQVVGQTLGPALGWRAVFLVFAPSFLVAAAVARWVLRPGESGQASTVRSAFAAMPQLLARPQLLALYGATVTLLGSFVALYTAVELAGPPSLTGHPTALLDLRASALPILLLVPAATPLLARITPGVRTVAGLGIAAGSAVAASSAGDSVVALALILVVFVAAIAVAAPAVVQTISGAAGPARGAAVALYAFATFLGASLAPQLVTALAGLGFARNALVVAATLALGSLLALLATRLAT